MNVVPSHNLHNAPRTPIGRTLHGTSRKSSIIFKCIIVIVACVLGLPNAVGLFFVLPTMVPLEFSDTIKVLNYFTFTACFACLAYYAADVLHLIVRSKDKAVGDIFPPLKHLITVSLLITMVVFIFWVDKSFFSLFSAPGSDKIAVLDTFLILLHTMLPLLVLTDWLLFDDKGRVRTYTVAVAVAGSLVYSAYILTISEFFGGSGITLRYLYPFFDVASLGWRRVILWALALTAVAALCAAGFLLADRILGHTYKKQTGQPLA